MSEMGIGAMILLNCCLFFSFLHANFSLNFFLKEQLRLILLYKFCPLSVVRQNRTKAKGEQNEDKKKSDCVEVRSAYDTVSPNIKNK